MLFDEESSVPLVSINLIKGYLIQENSWVSWVPILPKVVEAISVLKRVFIRVLLPTPVFPMIWIL